MSILLSLISVFPALAASGPSEIAIPDQTLWPAALSSRAAFDAASRAEILLFTNAYAAVSPVPVDGANEDSLRVWRERTEKLLLEGYKAASASCAAAPAVGCGFEGASFPELATFAAAFPATLPAAYEPWRAMTADFHRIYAAEQKRLATLFPVPTSEILPVADSEVFGDHYRDGEFLLSLDDGPTPVGGSTDGTVKALRDAGLTAQFFSLGDALTARLAHSSQPALAALYQGQCLGSHGFNHKSHQTWDGWRQSIRDTHALIRKIVPGAPVPFRPPYGQRTAELVAEQLTLDGSPVMLWNIDSQDWNPRMPKEKVAERIEKLMLLWRKGIVLMHDVHPKALVAVPVLARFAKEAGVKWLRCSEGF